MITKKEIEKKLTSLKPVLLQKYHVERIGYFGSFAKGNATETSDIDILLEFNKPVGWEFFDIQDLLIDSLKRKIDLVSINAIKKQLKDSILQQTIFV